MRPAILAGSADAPPVGPVRSRVVTPAELADLVNVDEVVPAYQPIVELETGEVVAWEALARWPGRGAPAPDQVFEAARRSGRLVELDWACRSAAIRDALAVGLRPGQRLFVNVEPDTLGQPGPAPARAIIDAARGRLSVVLELTERQLTHRPADLLALVGWARRQGWTIALDDVGAEPASLALLPFVDPDVVKLDLGLIQDQPRAAQAQVMAAVLAHAERTDATILAEGIETEAHLERALALGASLGQGWYFGRPGPLPRPGSEAAPGGDRTIRSTPAAPTAGTPFELVAGRHRLRRAPASLLLAISRHIERQGVTQDPPPVVLGAFQSAERFTATTGVAYSTLARWCPLVAAFAEDLPVEPAPGVRGGTLAPDDSLRREWTVVVLGAHYAGALIARQVGVDPGPARRFDFVVTHDRDTVVSAARSLLSRIEPVGGHRP